MNLVSLWRLTDVFPSAGPWRSGEQDPARVSAYGRNGSPLSCLRIPSGQNHHHRCGQEGQWSLSHHTWHRWVTGRRASTKRIFTSRTFLFQLMLPCFCRFRKLWGSILWNRCTTWLERRGDGWAQLLNTLLFILMECTDLMQGCAPQKTIKGHIYILWCKVQPMRDKKCPAKNRMKPSHLVDILSYIILSVVNAAFGNVF